VLDDDAIITSALARGLRRHGYVVDEHNSGTTAAMRLSERPMPDVIVTDWNMPGVDGELFLRFVAERCPKLPVIVITGDAAAVRMPATSGTASFSVLRKPFHPELLRRQIEQALALTPEDTARIEAGMGRLPS
jgi:DNA-binding NtrC family response regulator